MGMGECTVMGDRQQHVDSDDGALLRAKAMSTPSRVAIVARLHEAGVPLTAGQLADLLGIHHTAVRQHLAQLVEAGLVRPQPLPVQGRGRPRTGYTAVVAATPYRELAGVLVAAVSGGLSARGAGHEAGLGVEPSAAGALATLRDEAERLGFEPHVVECGESHEIVLGACPFVELATAQPDTVCQLHVGLAEGIAERAGGLVVDGIRLADPSRGGCRIMVHSTPT